MAGADPAPSDADIDAALDKLGVAAPDDKTFVVTLNTPATYFLSVALWVMAPVQEKWIKSQGPPRDRRLRFSQAHPARHLEPQQRDRAQAEPELVRRGQADPDRDRHVDVAEPADAQAAYEADEVDMVLPGPSEDIPAGQATRPFAEEYLEIPTLAITQYDYNNGTNPSGEGTLARCQDPKACPTTNKDFRIALTEAIDKQAFIDATFAGIGQVANSMVMPGLPGYDESINPYPFNLDDSAKQHMDKALQHSSALRHLRISG